MAEVKKQYPRLSVRRRPVLMGGRQGHGQWEVYYWFVYKHDSPEDMRGQGLVKYMSFNKAIDEANKLVQIMRYPQR